MAHAVFMICLLIGGCSGRSVPDRDCTDFDTWDEAQAFYESEDGRPDGSGRDARRLDADRDGDACEALR